MAIDRYITQSGYWYLLSLVQRSQALIVLCLPDQSLQMKKPDIKTAIPKRRYQIGDFVATILGEVESQDPIEYRYIMALVQDGTNQPCLYVTAETNPPNRRNQGRYLVRVILGNDSREMESADKWGEIEEFSIFALGIAAKLYQLMDEEPARLM